MRLPSSYGRGHSPTFQDRACEVDQALGRHDHGAAVILPGADISLTRHPDIEYLLFGNRAAIDPVLEKLPRLKAKSKVVHTEVAIRMDDKPSQALRYGRWKSSMWLAIDAVKKGEADVAVSAGNTGALMAMARFNLKMKEGIERPAIAALWPTLKGESVVLDVGAHAGQMAKLFAGLVPRGHVYAFEPGAYALAVLRGAQR